MERITNVLQSISFKIFPADLPFLWYSNRKKRMMKLRQSNTTAKMKFSCRFQFDFDSSLFSLDIPTEKNVWWNCDARTQRRKLSFPVDFNSISIRVFFLLIFQSKNKWWNLPFDLKVCKENTSLQQQLENHWQVNENITERTTSAAFKQRLTCYHSPNHSLRHATFLYTAWTHPFAKAL